MSMWILVFVMLGDKRGGPAVVENIESLAECQRVQQAIHEMHGEYVTYKTRCIEVRKAMK